MFDPGGYGGARPRHARPARGAVQVVAQRAGAGRRDRRAGRARGGHLAARRESLRLPCRAAVCKRADNMNVRDAIPGNLITPIPRIGKYCDCRFVFIFCFI